jgi:hypothetical protein
MQKITKLRIGRSGFLGAGLLILLFPALDDLVGDAYGLLVLVPCLFGAGLGTLVDLSRDEGYVHLVLIAGAVVGVLVQLAAGLLQISGSKPTGSFVIVGIIGGFGLILYLLSVVGIVLNSDSVSVPGVVVLGLFALPLVDPFFAGIVTPVFGFSISLTGLSWMVFGIELGLTDPVGGPEAQ